MMILNEDAITEVDDFKNAVEIARSMQGLIAADAMKRDATPEQLRVFAITVLLDQGFLELEY